MAARHAFDATSFVAGLVFVVAGTAFVLADVVDLDLELRWLLPAGLVAAGLIGLAAALGPALRRRSRPDPDPHDGDDRADVRP